MSPAERIEGKWLSGRWNWIEMNWTYGAVPLARDEIHDKVIEMMGKEPQGQSLGCAHGTGILGRPVEKDGFDHLLLWHSTLLIFSDFWFSDWNPVIWTSPFFYPSDLDFITCVEGLEHLENPFKALREFHRLLKPGGKVILSLPIILILREGWNFSSRVFFSKSLLLRS